MANLKQNQRMAMILAAATTLSEDGTLYSTLTADDVADKAECSRATVLGYFGSMQGLRDSVVCKAIDDKNLNILAQALVGKDPLINGVPEALREKAALSLIH